GAQTDTVGQVRFQPLDLSRVEALGRQQQVDADGTTDPPNRDEQLREVRVGREEFGELVDDDEQVGERLQIGVLLPFRLVGVQVREVTRLLEPLLSAYQLPVGGLAKPHDE